MKRVIKYAGLFILSGFFLAGCYKDVISPEADPDGPPQAVSFKQDLVPILSTNCAITGCHVSGSRKPFLTSAVAYQELVNGGYVNTIIPKESILYKSINGSMVQYMTIKADRQKVYDWIRNGAPNN